MSKKRCLDRSNSNCRVSEAWWYCYIPGAAVVEHSEPVAQDEKEVGPDDAEPFF